MDQQDQTPAGPRKTFEEVKEERRAERIASVTDVEFRNDIERDVQVREKSLSEMKETLKKRYWGDVEDIRMQRRQSGFASVSTSEAEVTIQHSGWLKGLANRHNQVIDQRLDEYEGVNGSKVDWNRYTKDDLYRKVIQEEGRSQPPIQRSLGMDGSF